MTHATPDAETCHDTLTSVTSRSGRGTARQTIRLDEALWDRFDRAAKASGADRSTLIRAFVAWYVREPGAKPVKRPDAVTNGETAASEDAEQP